MVNFTGTANFIWAVADLLRGDFKQSQYGRIILPFTLLRRPECELVSANHAMNDAFEKYKDMCPAAGGMLKLVSDNSIYEI